ncbi:dihydrodipicolinate synthase family protein [Pacificispira sp.]|uniref:dihydrodipicolinate synthase family protein n=1 Tax=Pacificispira sp. TaxID=2888761 RepID=UPI003BAA3C3F
MPRFDGIFPYIVSPVSPDGTVRRQVLATLCGDLIAKGVHGLAALGSTGEFAYLDRGQKEAVVQTVVAAAEKRVPVLAGVSSTSTRDAVDQARGYENLGVDGIIAVIDSYFPLAPHQVEGYFRAIADAVAVPIVLYTNPNFQRTDLSIDMIVRLSQHERIQYLKDASFNTGRLLSIQDRCGDDLGIFAASSHLPVAVMMIGGQGWMAGPACLVPEQCVRLYDFCRKGEWERAAALQRRLWVLNDFFNRNGLAACVKAGLTIQGYNVGDPVAPQSPLAPSQWQDLERLLAQLAAPCDQDSGAVLEESRC